MIKLEQSVLCYLLLHQGYPPQLLHSQVFCIYLIKYGSFYCHPILPPCTREVHSRLHEESLMSAFSVDAMATA